MKRASRASIVGVTVACSVALARVTLAESIVIDHKPIGCVVAGKFPRLEARFDPADQVSRARIDFHAGGDTRWYFVEMKPEEGVYRGILPQPLKITKTIHYYIEVTATDSAEGRTEEYSPVVASAGECDKKGLLTASPLTKALVTVKSAGQPTAAGAAGSPTVPAGFASAGGVSAGVVAAGVVGAGAAVAGAVAIAGGNQSTTTTIPTVTGRWVGRAPDGFVTTSIPSGCLHELDASLDLTQSGNGLSGTLTMTVRRVETPVLQVCVPVGTPSTSAVTGTVNGASLTFRGANFPGATGDAIAVGTVAGNRMSGTVSGPIFGGSFTGTWSLVRQ